MTTTIPGFADVRESLARNTPRFAELLRTVRDPKAKAVGDWSIRDVAVHAWVAAACDGALAGGEPVPPQLERFLEAGLGARRESLGDLNQRTVDEEPEQDPAALAERIERCVDAALAAATEDRADDLVPWLAGVELPKSTVLAHLMSELVLHGHDVARAEGRPWEVGTTDALVVHEHFIRRFITTPGVERFLAANVAGAKPVSAELNIKGLPPARIDVDDGSMTPGPADGRPVDVRITADPAAMLLVMYRRANPLGPVVRRRLVLGGRRPWRLPRLMRALRTP